MDWKQLLAYITSTLAILSRQGGGEMSFTIDEPLKVHAMEEDIP